MTRKERKSKDASKKALAKAVPGKRKRKMRRKPMKHKGKGMEKERPKHKGKDKNHRSCGKQRESTPRIINLNTPSHQFKTYEHNHDLKF